MLFISRNKTVYVRKQDILDISIAENKTIEISTKENDAYGSIIEIYCDREDDLCVVYDAILFGFETRHGIVDIRTVDTIGNCTIIRRKKNEI